MLPLNDITADEVRECAGLFFPDDSAQRALARLEGMAARFGVRQWSHRALCRVMAEIERSERLEAARSAKAGKLPPVRMAQGHWVDLLMEWLPMDWKLDDCDQILRLLVRQCGHIEVNALTAWDGIAEYRKRFAKR